jgi:hypothetical protein
MSVSIFTSEAQIALYDDDNQRWGNYTDAKNLVELSITKPEPTNIKNVSSRPDDTFAQTTDSFLIGTGSPTLTLSTRDVVNRNTIPVEMSMLAAALAAKMSAINKVAATKHPFTGFVDQLGLNIDTGDTNLVANSAVVHKQTVLGAGMTGLMSGSVASATATTIDVTTAGWTIDALIGKKVAITGGAGAGQVIAITDNDADTITVGAFSPTPDATSTFAVVESAALASGTAYSVDSVYGTIKPLPGGGLAVGDTLVGFVDSLGLTGTRLRGATKDAVTFRVRGKAKDIKNGSKGFLTIHRVVAYTSEAQQFVANAESPEFKLLTLTGEIETPDGMTEPYTFDTELVYATS